MGWSSENWEIKGKELFLPFEATRCEFELIKPRKSTVVGWDGWGSSVLNLRFWIETQGDRETMGKGLYSCYESMLYESGLVGLNIEYWIDKYYANDAAYIVY